jgi:hypothetical protein
MKGILGIIALNSSKVAKVAYNSDQDLKHFFMLIIVTGGSTSQLLNCYLIGLSSNLFVSQTR